LLPSYARPALIYPEASPSFSLPSAFSGNHCTATMYAMASDTKMTQIRWPSIIWLRTPVAKMLENAAGATALMPLTTVKARALSVPRVDGEGAISLSASCTAAAKHVSD
jgi:hypothetical protein